MSVFTILFIPANCVDPGTPAFGSQTGTYKHSDVLFFNCTVGYDLIGADQLTCNNGVWTNDIPTCQCKKNSCQLNIFSPICYENNPNNAKQIHKRGPIGLSCQAYFLNTIMAHTMNSSLLSVCRLNKQFSADYFESAF